MRALAFILASLAFSSAASAETYSRLLTCASNAPGASLFVVESNTEGTVQYLSKYPEMPGSEATIRIPLSGVQVWGYGDTYIISENFGRSGYAHLYANLQSGVTVIDINMFMNSASTSGPLTNYTCHEPVRN